MERVRSRPVLAAALLAAALLLTGCTGRPAAAPSVAAPPSAAATGSASPSPTPTGAPLTIAAIGDSLSRGFDACAHFGDCPEVSWSTGRDAAVDSIARRLQVATGRPVTAVSAARSGATSDDLQRQAAVAAAAQPALVTLLIGGNDVCRASLGEMTPTAVFADRIAGALTTVHDADPDAVVLVASAPDVTALLPAAAEDPTARFLWQRAGGCATVLQDPLASTAEAEARRQAVRLRLAEYNVALQAACAAQTSCVWDDGALAAYRPSLQQLSALDYFHPSVAGQATLARLEWAPLQRSGRLASLR